MCLLESFVASVRDKISAVISNQEHFCEILLPHNSIISLRPSFLEPLVIHNMQGIIFCWHLFVTCRRMIFIRSYSESIYECLSVAPSIHVFLSSNWNKTFYKSFVRLKDEPN